MCPPPHPRARASRRSCQPRSSGGNARPGRGRGLRGIATRSIPQARRGDYLAEAEDRI